MSENKPIPEEQQPAPEAKVMSPEKRTALLRYMAILFAVAFALVLLSYLIQVRNSQSTITALNQTSASALQNAEALQQANQELTEDKTQLTEALAEALAALEQAEAQASEQSIAAGEAQKALEQSKEAYDLLLTAVQAFHNADRVAYDKAMTDLTSIKDSLSETAQELYKTLKATPFPAPAEEPAETEESEP